MLRTRQFLALFRKKPNSSSPSLRRHLFPLTLPLQTLQLVHGAIQLPVQVSFIAEKLVGCIRGRQAEASGFRVSHELLALLRVSLEYANSFQLMFDHCENCGASFLGFFVVHSSSELAFPYGCWRTGVATLKCEPAVPKAEFAKNLSTSLR